jgi:hypothetical protein
MHALQIRKFGPAVPQIAAKIVKDGVPIAVIMCPRNRWSSWQGGCWVRENEWEFTAVIERYAQQHGGEAVMAWTLQT